MNSITKQRKKKSRDSNSIKDAFFLYLYYLGIPIILVAGHASIDQLFIKAKTENEYFFGLNYTYFTFILIAMYLIMLLVMIFSIMIFAYNLYYLKTETSTQAIYGIFEIFYAIIAFILFFFSQSVISNNDTITLYLAYVIGLYVPIYVVVRGYENIGKRYKNQKGKVFCIKFGTDNEGKLVYYTKPLLKIALILEKKVSESQKSN